MGGRSHGRGDRGVKGVFLFCIEKGEAIEGYHAVGDATGGKIGGYGFGSADDDLVKSLSAARTPLVGSQAM